MRWAVQYPHHASVLLFNIVERQSGTLRTSVLAALDGGQDVIFAAVAQGIVTKNLN